MLWVKDDPDVRFLLAEGMVIVEQNLGQEEVLLACAAPILRNILSYGISTPEISLSVRVPDSKTIDPKWLLERTIEVDIILSYLSLAMNSAHAYAKCFVLQRTYPSNTFSPRKSLIKPPVSHLSMRSNSFHKHFKATTCSILSEPFIPCPS